jgi:hypothetical protein
MPVPPTESEFPELDAQRLYLERLLRVCVPSLAEYWQDDLNGFVHIQDGKVRTEASPSSTATCISYLVESGRWNRPDAPWKNAAQRTLDAITSKSSSWESGGLERDNAFTSAFLVQAIADLHRAGAKLNSSQRKLRDKKLAQLHEFLEDGTGVKVQNYPASAFLTYKVVEALDSWQRFDFALPAIVKTKQWAWSTLTDESVAVSSDWPDSDVLELIYACMLAGRCTPANQMSEKQREALEFAVGQFFSAQTKRGRWPRGRALFIYPEFGHAFCYDFEALTYLLNEKSLSHLLHKYLPELGSAAKSLDDSKQLISPKTKDVYAWATGHLKQGNPPPESWSTASAYHFAFLLHRLVAEVIRRTVFSYASCTYSTPVRGSQRSPNIDAAKFLDSNIKGSEGRPKSLTRVIENNFLKPLTKSSNTVADALDLPDTVPTSAILFGPPGTSKTQLAGIIADTLGWPLLKLDPSHLTRRGMDQLHAETDRVFSMLAACQEIVVLFDEFDELVRDRDEGSESLSRFLTTAMLPKLTSLSKRRRIVYLLATNHVERFDPAIRRRGRFDLILPIMPPTHQAKEMRWPMLKTKCDGLGLTLEKRAALGKGIDDLTFDECQELVNQIAKKADSTKILKDIDGAIARCTLNQKVNSARLRDEQTDQDYSTRTWKDELDGQMSIIRIPNT